MFLIKIKNIFVPGCVVMLFSNIIVYLYTVQISSITPLLWIEAMMFMALIIFIPLIYGKHKSLKGFVASPLMLWIILYLIVLIIWFAMPGQTDLSAQVFNSRLFSALVLVFLSFIMWQDQKVIENVQLILIVLVLLAVVNNIAEFIFPGLFTSYISGLYSVGRSAGLYINSNMSGMALVLGMVMSMSRIPRKYRWIFVITVLAGIIVTFSRASQLGWIVGVLLLIYFRQLKISSVLLGLCIFTALTVIVLPTVLNKLQTIGGINLIDISNRISWIGNPEILSLDHGVNARLDVAKISWQMFLNKPLLGNGIGSTQVWAEQLSTHNMFLYYMADYGIVGIIFIPLLIIACVWRSTGEIKKYLIIFGILIFQFSFFSHNLISDYYSLVIISLAAALANQSNVGNVKPEINLE